MGLIREPLDVDFEVVSQPLTKEEEEKISNYIRQYKARHNKKKLVKRVLRTSLRKKIVRLI